MANKIEEKGKPEKAKGRTEKRWRRSMEIEKGIGKQERDRFSGILLPVWWGPWVVLGCKWQE